MKIKREEKKRKHSELVWSPVIRSGRARKTCYMSSPVFGWKGTRGCVWSRKEL